MPHAVALLLANAACTPVDTPVLAGRLSENDPFAQTRKTAFIDDHGIAAGTVEASGMLTVAEYPHTEMLVVHRGRVTLRSEGQVLELGAGKSAVIGRGTAVQIDAQPASLWAFCAAVQSTGEDKPGVVPIDRYAPLAPSAAPEASILVSPEPQCRSNNLFVDPASPLRIGVWDSTPYSRDERAHKVHELMHVIEGEVLLQGQGGGNLRVKAGDTVFVVQGTPCAWVSERYVRKFYAVN